MQKPKLFGADVTFGCKKLMVIPFILLLAITASQPLKVSASTSQSTSNFHLVNQTATTVNIEDRQYSVSYHPGVLIGFPIVNSYRVTTVVPVANFSSSGYIISLTGVDVTFQNRNISTMVLMATSENSDSQVRLATIIVLGVDGSYGSLETDIFVSGVSSKLSTNSSTQELVYQSFTQSLSDHFANLHIALGQLIAGYESSSIATGSEVANIYTSLDSLVQTLHNTMQTKLAKYNLPVRTSAAVITGNVIPLTTQTSCGSQFLAAEKDNGQTSGGEILGTFYSWNILGYRVNYDYLSFSGSVSVISPTVAFEIIIGQDTWDAIAGYSFSHDVGVYNYNVNIYQNVFGWDAVGAGGEDVSANTGGFAVPYPPVSISLTLFVEIAIGEFSNANGNLNTCT